MTPGLPCCFEGLLKAAVEKEACHFLQGDKVDLFGGSPLSSANPSPLNSPLLQPVEARHFSQGYGIDPFGGSPLSSAPSSANSSPLNSPHLLPVEPGNEVFEFCPDLLGQPSNTTAAVQRMGSGRKAYKWRQSHARHKKKREAMKAMDPAMTRPAIIEKHVASAEPVNIAFDLVDGSAASGTYVGIRSKPSKTLHGLDDLVGEKSKWKSKYVAWDGRYGPVASLPLYLNMIISASLPLVDSAGHLIGVGIGKPEGSDAHQMAAEIIEKARSRCDISPKDRTHRHGCFIALRVGVSHGQGQKQPGVLKNNAANSTVLGEILEHKAFHRLSKHITSKPWVAVYCLEC